MANALSVTQKFWSVVVVTTDASLEIATGSITRQYATYEKAAEAAFSFAKNYPGRLYHVLESVAAFKAESVVERLACRSKEDMEHASFRSPSYNGTSGAYDSVASALRGTCNHED